MEKSKKKGGLRFRDIECFNNALLAKQCWRLLTDSTSMSTQIMMEKYCKNRKLLEAPQDRVHLLYGEACGTLWI